ncbi:MAG: hypothetical protein HY077_02155 [Elusimicrobia bacterium]|nr:hypothetical protein [Elusimicrobiota bacterium]
MLLIAGATLGLMLLYCAVLGFLHRGLAYRRADLLTTVGFAALAGTAFALDPLRETVGKDSLYVMMAAGAALMGFVALKLEAKVKHGAIPILVVPVLASVFSSLFYLVSLAADINDYQPPRQQPRVLSKVVHTLARKPRR